LEQYHRFPWVPASLSYPWFCPLVIAVSSLCCWCVPSVGAQGAPAPAICGWCAGL